MALSRNLLLHACEAELPAPKYLRAGPLTLQYSGGDTRYIRWGQTEIVRRIYAAVRDRNWGTVPFELTEESIEDNVDSFCIRFTATHRQHEIGFCWRGEISGHCDGTIRFHFDGEALTTFQRNRIGFCVLHPIRECAGANAQVEHADGTQEIKSFPRHIAPDAPFENITALSHEVQPNIWARLQFEGDVFEMEDQRNWIDASFKTFCTPLSLPYPVLIEAGTRVVQTVTLRLDGEVPTLPAAEEASCVTLQIGKDVLAKLPPLGLGVAHHDKVLSPREIERLQRLNLQHLRVDLALADAGWPEKLRRSTTEALALKAQLEVALFLSANAEHEFDSLLSLLHELNPPIDAFLIFPARLSRATVELLKLARQKLGSYDATIPLGAGSNAYFTEFNRGRPPFELLDFGVYSANPQVHAFDNTSLIETLETLPHTIESARALAPQLPAAISPITLRPRFNAVATGPQRVLASDELPDNVDARQMSLFGAAWTLGALAALAPYGLRHLTFYETTGWRGVMESEAGAPIPTFPSIAGAVFPLYHVFAALADFAGAEVLPVISSDELRIRGLALRQSTLDSTSQSTLTRVLIANYHSQAQQIEVQGIAETAQLRVLDESNTEQAMREPEAFLQDAGQSTFAPHGVLKLTLNPYAIARLDF
jgi:hypothetical protein